MALSLVGRMAEDVGELRFVPTPKRIRLDLDGEPVADTTKAMVVWEPKRLLPYYAVPEHDVAATLEPAPASDMSEDVDARVLNPREPFQRHTTPGDGLTVVTSGGRREAAAFRFADPDLAGYVGFDFAAFSCREEDEAIFGHPRDPFHRIDIRQSNRCVRVEHDGRVLAESTRPKLLFEGVFPFARYYLPREDIVVDLAPSALTTTCAYKGRASYFSATVDDTELTDIAWCYQEPFDEAAAIGGLICFYQERLQVFIDGRPLERAPSPWS